MFQGFVHPALALGALLAAVPLIIHLLNRQRHKPVPWAAMRFVLAAYRKTRRRVQLENLILLLLRMAAVALLAFAIARPFASDDSPLAALTEERRDVVLVIDGSASTGYREGVETVYERLLTRARDLVAKLDGARGDRIRLIHAGAYPRPVSWTSPEKALAILSTMTEPTDEALDLASALGEVLDLVEEDAAGTGQSSLEVRLLSDLQRNSFDPVDTSAAPGSEDSIEDAGAAPRVAEQLDALAALGVTVLVQDQGTGATTPPNLSITAVQPLEPILGPGVTVDIGVRIANHGNEPRNGVRVWLDVDGERQPSRRVDIPARGQADAVFSLQFADTGAHTLVGGHDGDRLAVDDQRARVIFVPAPIRILVVNGSSAGRIEDDETGFLMAILEPPDDAHLPGTGGLSPFDPREINPEFLASPDLELDDFDVILLANVSPVTLTKPVVADLEDRIARGGSLIITLGDRSSRTKASGGASPLFRPDGSGLLPAELLRRVQIASRRDGYYRVASFDEHHPTLSFFADDRWKPLLTEVPIYEFVTTRPLGDARVLATLDDEGASPLLIERPYDEGQVLLWTTTLDRAWTRLPESPRTFVPLVHQWMLHAGRSHIPARNIAPTTSLFIDVVGFPRGPELVRPDSTRRALEGEPEETGSGEWRLPEVRSSDTERAGLYRIEIEGASAVPFAVHVDPSEGNLERMLPAEIGGLHRALEMVDDGPDRGEQEGGPRRGEIWRWLAMAALFALIGETLWGAWVGTKRGVAR
ncbi:MAG: hypothetical protein ACI8QZ_000407 [Chlamydiales bacterium]